MKPRKLWVSILAILLAILMVGGVVFSALSVLVSAASSSELKQELDNLKNQADDIAAESAELDRQIAENESETQSIVEKKENIDQQMDLTRQQIENLSAQIQQYNLLIAAKQEELDQAEIEAQEMNERYKLRLRTMEEEGNVSYWSVLFQANSFTDLLDRIDMIQEIAQADQTMLERMRQVAEEIAAAKVEIEDNKAALEEAKAELAVLEAQLEDQRAEADAMITQLMANREELLAVSDTYDALEAEVRQQIQDVQTAYENALADEEAQRKIEAAREQAASGSVSKPSSTSSSGFLYPLAASGTITDAYGYRWHPIYEAYRFHTGVDFAVGRGTAIYATRSGTVTAAAYSTYNGNYVAINHNDGYTSLYGHMTNYIVSPGQSVSQGQVIGYEGSTGVSTGPHLHFEITYGGANVNPMDYVSIP